MGLGLVPPAFGLLLPLAPIADELAMAGQWRWCGGWSADRLIHPRSMWLSMVVPLFLGNSVILDLVDTRTHFMQNILDLWIRLGLKFLFCVFDSFI